MGAWANSVWFRLAWRGTIWSNDTSGAWYITTPAATPKRKRRRILMVI
jgi:hypothetical protein